MALCRRLHEHPGNRSILLNSIYSKGHCNHSSCSSDRRFPSEKESTMQETADNSNRIKNSLPKDTRGKQENIKIHGIGLDKAGRCTHYHTQLDIAALLCAKCRKYYACYSCHDELEDHSFVATTPEEAYPVLCGNCGRKLTLQEYKKGSCPYCHAGFNPKCSLHENIYFCCTM